MDLALPYGRGHLSLIGVPADTPTLWPPVHAATSIEPAQLSEVLADKCRHPIGSPSLRDWLDPTRPLTIIVPDKTRKAGVPAYLPVLLDHLRDLGVAAERIRILIGLGTHPGHNPEELRALLTPTIAAAFGARGALRESAGQRAAEFVDLGSTARGTPVRLHEWLVGDSQVLVTGGIVYHYYAGYGGGRKGVLPGCAEAESIRASHRLAFECDQEHATEPQYVPREHGSAPDDAPGTTAVRRHPHAASGILEGNPVYLDQLEAARRLPRPPFLLNTITDPAGRLIDLVTGDLERAHVYGCTLVDQYYQCPLPGPLDWVVASAGGFPGDINLIQSHKALDNAIRALRPGGTVVLLAECSQGLGNPRAEAWAALGSANAVLQRLGEAFEIIGGTCEGLFRKGEGYRVHLVSMLPPEIPEAFGFQARAPRDSQLDLTAWELDGAGALLPAAGITVPRY